MSGSKEMNRQAKINEKLEVGELARPIPNTELDYWATTFGRIFSFKRGSLSELSQSVSRGYRQTAMVNGTNRVHKMVLLTFRGEPQDGQISRHLDGNPANNRLDNLKYGTHKENYQDSVDHGTAVVGTLSGEDHPGTDLKDEDVLTIRHRAAVLKESYSAIGRDYGITNQAIKDIAQGNNWTSVGGPIDQKRKSSEQDIAVMIKMRESGAVLRVIAEKFDLDISTVSRIMKKFNVKKGKKAQVKEIA